MTDLNHVVLMGNITRNISDDERSFGYLANGSARANISIAVNRSRKQGDEWIDEVSYFDVAIFGKTAENLKPYFVKGQRVTVEGHLKQDRWEKDGQKNSRVSIVADAVYLCGSKKDSGNNAPSNNQQNNYQAAKPTFNGSTANGNVDYESFPEDIPF